MSKASQETIYYKRITIFGPDDNGSYAKDLKQALQEASTNPSDCIVIGDGKMNITPDILKESLNGKIDANTQIQLAFHGDTGVEDLNGIAFYRRSKHYIDTHQLHEPDMPEAELIAILSELAHGHPLNLILATCYGMAANESMVHAPEGSKMITQGDPSETTTGSDYFFSDLQKPLPDMFLHFIERTSQTSTLSVKSSRGIIIYYYKPFGGDPFMELSQAREYIYNAQKKFITWCEENNIQLEQRSKDEIFQRMKAGQPSDEGLKDILTHSAFNSFNAHGLPLSLNVDKFITLCKSAPKYPWLQLALEYKDKELLKRLIGERLGLNVMGFGFHHIMVQASYKFDEGETLKMLAKAGADPNARDLDGLPVLYHVADIGGISELHLYSQLCCLRDLGADPNVEDVTGNRIILTAAMAGKERTARRLQEIGANPNERDKQGDPIILAAAMANNDKAVRILKNVGADPNASIDDQPILFTAMERGNAAAAINLLAVGADMNLQYQGMSIVEYARVHGVYDKITEELARSSNSELKQVFAKWTSRALDEELAGLVQMHQLLK